MVAMDGACGWGSNQQNLIYDSLDKFFSKRGDMKCKLLSTKEECSEWSTYYKLTKGLIDKHVRTTTLLALLYCELSYFIGQ